jgi:hypothetical protein
MGHLLNGQQPEQLWNIGADGATDGYNYYAPPIFVISQRHTGRQTFMRRDKRVMWVPSILEAVLQLGRKIPPYDASF